MRIVWLAAADARGHLMRAHLMRGLLARSGVRVDVVTTSQEGRAFLAALGTQAGLLSCHYGVAFDDRQNMQRERTEACILHYLLKPSRGAADLARLAEVARASAYVVNDFHPLLLVAGSMGALPCPVVHVYGENLWRAIEGNFAGRGPRALGKGYGALVRALRDRAFACVEHSLAAPLAGAQRAGPRGYRLPPLVAAPRRSAACVRASLGIDPRERLAAVYLNPHFTDPRVADAIERTLASQGFRMHAVGEGFRRRAGWAPYDADFVDVTAAADLLISAPGMGALGQARLLGTPLVALVTDQPEQRANLAFLGRGAPAAVEIEGVETLETRLGDAVARLAATSEPALARPAAAAAVHAVHERWVNVFEELVRAAPSSHHDLRRPKARLHRPQNEARS